MKRYQEEIDRIILNAFNEDIKTGDITTLACVPLYVKGKGELLVKQDGILAGIDIVKRIFSLYDNQLIFRKYFRNGDIVKAGDVIAVIKGSAASILTAERTALNFLQRMCGIATYSRQLSDLIKHTKARIIDTRKTAPGLRVIDKLAMTRGGGKNHRMGLYDMFLIKDNHIEAAGSITKAVESCRQFMKQHNHKFRIEVETENIEQVNEALQSKVDIIMLDNFEIDEMKKAVNHINGRVIVEASGGINLHTVKAIAETGVDFISVGAITHSVKGLDISLELKLT